jgi:hypothetical protein
MIGRELVDIVSFWSFLLSIDRDLPNPLVGRDARAAVACTAPITREHRAAVLLTFRMGTTTGSASAVIVTVAERG